MPNPRSTPRHVSHGALADASTRAHSRTGPHTHAACEWEARELTPPVKLDAPHGGFTSKFLCTTRAFALRLAPPACPREGRAPCLAPTACPCRVWVRSKFHAGGGRAARAPARGRAEYYAARPSGRSWDGDLARVAPRKSWTVNAQAMMAFIRHRPSDLGLPFPPSQVGGGIFAVIFS